MPSNTKNVTQGWISGFIGVVIFAGSLSATCITVMDLDRSFIGMLISTLGAVVYVVGAKKFSV